jgi:hypothetical protein
MKNIATSICLAAICVAGSFGSAFAQAERIFLYGALPETLSPPEAVGALPVPLPRPENSNTPILRFENDIATLPIPIPQPFAEDYIGYACDNGLFDPTAEEEAAYCP